MDSEADVPSGNYIVFAARNKTVSTPSSPRKRGPSEDAHNGKARSSANRRSGASSASHLHRGMLDKALKKAKISHDHGADMQSGRGR